MCVIGDLCVYECVTNDVSVSLMIYVCVQAELMEELNKYKKLGKLS